MNHTIRFLIIISVLAASNAAARYSGGNLPKECQADGEFCMSFCISANPETVNARCGKDKISCICTTKLGHSVKVQFIEERDPVPPTRPPPPPVQYVSSEPAHSEHLNPSLSWDTPMPQLLVCDGTRRPTEVCNDFCISDIKGTSGKCNITDYTCLCFGVSPAVVQNVPIPAVFTGAIPPTTTPSPVTTTTQRPLLSYQQPKYWTPITSNHPNFYANSPSNGLYYQYFRNQPYQNEPYYQYQQPNLDPWNPATPGNYQYQPQQYQEGQQPMTYDKAQTQIYQTSEPILPSQFQNSDTLMNPQLQEANTDFHTTTVAPIQSSTDEAPVDHPNHQTEQSQHVPVALNTFENHRSRRSTRRTYANVLSYGKMDRQSCSIYSCQDACTKSLPNCLPKCIENRCVCLCKPDGIQNFQDEIVQDIKHEFYESSETAPVPVAAVPLKRGMSSSVYSQVQLGPRPGLNLEDGSGTPPPPPALY